MAIRASQRKEHRGFRLPIEYTQLIDEQAKANPDLYDSKTDVVIAAIEQAFVKGLAPRAWGRLERLARSVAMSPSDLVDALIDRHASGLRKKRRD